MTFIASDRVDRTPRASQALQAQQLFYQSTNLPGPVANMSTSTEQHILQEATIKMQREEIEELKLKHRKELAELEASIGPREVDVKVREEAVKAKQQELKSQSRRTTNEGKKSANEMKTAKSKLKKQLRAAEVKAAKLEGELKSANDKYSVLKLDYDGVLSELDKMKLADQKPKDKGQNAFQKIKEEQDRYKGLCEERINEPFIRHRVREASRALQAKMDANFKAKKAEMLDLVRDCDAKMLEVQARAKETEKRTREVQDAAGITKDLIDRGEKIVQTYENNIRLTDTNSRMAKELRSKINELSEKNAELDRVERENLRLKKALASALE